MSKIGLGELAAIARINGCLEAAGFDPTQHCQSIHYRGLSKECYNYMDNNQIPHAIVFAKHNRDPFRFVYIDISQTSAILTELLMENKEEEPDMIQHRLQIEEDRFVSIEHYAYDRTQYGMVPRTNPYTPTRCYGYDHEEACSSKGMRKIIRNMTGVLGPFRQVMYQLLEMFLFLSLHITANELPKHNWPCLNGCWAPDELSQRARMCLDWDSISIELYGSVVPVEKVIDTYGAYTHYSSVLHDSFRLKKSGIYPYPYLDHFSVLYYTSFFKEYPNELRKLNKTIEESKNNNQKFHWQKLFCNQMLGYSDRIIEKMVPYFFTPMLEVMLRLALKWNIPQHYIHKLVYQYWCTIVTPVYQKNRQKLPTIHEWRSLPLQNPEEEILEQILDYHNRIPVHFSAPEIESRLNNVLHIWDTLSITKRYHFISCLVDAEPMLIMDGLRMLQLLFTKVPHYSLPAYKTMRELHDILARDYQLFQNKRLASIPINQAMDWLHGQSFTIDSKTYYIVTAKQGAVVLHWGMDLNNCLSSYIDLMARGESMNYGVYTLDSENHPNLVACFEIKPNNTKQTHQFVMKYNNDAPTDWKTAVEEILQRGKKTPKQSYPPLLDAIKKGDGIDILDANDFSSPFIDNEPFILIDDFGEERIHPEYINNPNAELANEEEQKEESTALEHTNTTKRLAAPPKPTLCLAGSVM